MNQKQINAMFPDTTKKEPVIKKYYPPDEKYFTRMFNRDMLLIGLFGVASAVALVVLFYAIIYGPVIDKTLPH